MANFALYLFLMLIATNLLCLITIILFGTGSAIIKSIRGKRGGPDE